MIKTERKSILIAFAACAAVFLLSVAYGILIDHGNNLTEIIWADLLLIQLIMIALMIHLLRKSLHVTLYSYSNIGLIGGILFASFFTIVLFVEFIGYLGGDEASFGKLFQNFIELPRTFSMYALFVILFISLLVAVSNIVLIRREGFCLNNLLGLLLAAFYTGATVIIYYLVNLLTESGIIYTLPCGALLAVGLPMFFLLVLCYLECILAGTAIMGWLAAHQVPHYDKDYIIILGCSIDKRGGLLPLLKGRVNRAIRFAWEQEIATGKPLKYVPSGGQGANEIMSEGSAMELYLLTRGAESYEVFPEKKSVNTWENMLFSKQLIDELKPDAKIAFATTNYHMLRSGIIARKAGLDVEGIAGDTKWYFWPNGFIREFFGILALNINVHLISAAVIAAICALVTFAGYLGSMFL